MLAPKAKYVHFCIPGRTSEDTKFSLKKKKRTERDEQKPRTQVTIDNYGHYTLRKEN